MSTFQNKVFIATSIDGYISDSEGGIDWLHSIPNPDGNDMGYAEFMSEIDALVMGRNTFQTVCGFGIDWPYTKPVYVLSKSLKKIPEEYSGKVTLINGPLEQVLKKIHDDGHNRLYIDGGRTIQGFLKEDMINEMTITVIPVLLGGGVKLFSDLPHLLGFECVDTRHFLGKVGQSRFVRKNNS